jgi:uncharacterized membrane protein YdbT with pleckstrin-like domain
VDDQSPSSSKEISRQEVILKFYPSWFHESKLILSALVLAVIAVLILAYNLLGSADAFAWILGLLALALFIMAFMRHYTTAYTITGSGVSKKRGIFSTYLENIPYNKIQDIRLSQSFLGRILNVGNIYLDTAGTPGIEMVLRGVPGPQKIYNLLTKNSGK